MNNIALFGCGTVGKGVKDLVAQNPRFNLKAVFDKPEKKKELGTLLVTNPDDILHNGSIDTVIECLGGDALAHDIIMKALTNGKNVISSNKETISRHLKEYLILANQNHVSIQFEAAVGGGIPLLYPLSIQSQFDEIREIQGILNGTTNFILSKMQDEKMGKDEAIQEAIKKGFAEKDPTADLQGLDMVRKSCILADILTKKEIHNEDIPTFGIIHIDEFVLEQIAKRKRILKFVSTIDYEQGKLSIAVMPIALKKNNPLSTIKEENNGILVLGTYQEPLLFVGKGAGRNPTASAILQDLIRVSEHIAYPYPLLGDYHPLVNEFKGHYLGFIDHKMVEFDNPSIEVLRRYPFVCKEE
jgi:homoserine dehydrogenase